MINRRVFLWSSTALAGVALVGCGMEMEEPRPEGLPPGSIDIHAHIFNATDIPVPGFLDQVFLRHPEQPVVGPYTPNALVRLVTEILTQGVSTAREELRRLPGSGAVPRTDEDLLLAQDRNAVAEGVRSFEQAQLVDPVVVTESGAAPQSRRADNLPSEDADLLASLDALAATSGLDTSPDVDVRSVPSDGTEAAIVVAPPDRADAVAQAVFEDDPRNVVARTLRARDTSLVQTLRWAALLTRDRRDILAELIRLFGPRRDDLGNQVGIAAFSPSIVDFELWFQEPPQSRYSSLHDQIELMSRLALLETDAVLLNFAPFCPLRAIQERRAGRDWHAVLRNAIRTKGFVGLKLYPPMGFRPLANDPDRAYGQQIKATGAEIDAELRRLYTWCARQGVPIKAHGNNSLAAEECSGQNAAPDLWAPVLEAYPDLRVNIAHFGGFEEDDHHGSDDHDDCGEKPPSYEARAAALISGANRAYVDLGYWDEVVGSNAPGSAVIRAINDLLQRNPVLGQRVMYGSDYSMIGRVIGHGNYLSDVSDAVGRLDGAVYEDVMRGNAMRYLGLDDPDSGTRRRLARFFPRDHPYYALVGA